MSSKQFQEVMFI